MASATAQATDINFDQRWGPWASLTGAYSTEQSSYGEFAVFAPLAQTPSSLFFTELQGRYIDGDILEGNAALGYRVMSQSGFNLGAWAGLDVRRTGYDNTFGQVSAGLEALSDHVDFRINGYLPLSGLQSVPDGVAKVVQEDANIFMVNGAEVALYGIDGEIGGRLPLGPGNAATLGVYGGGYWFDHADVAEAVTGGMARVELALADVVGPGSQLTARYRYTHDNVYGDNHQIGAALRIPLGPTRPARAMTAQQWRMLDGIAHIGVVTGLTGKEHVEDALTGVDFDRVVSVDGDAGDQIGDTTEANRLLLVTGAFTDTQTLNGAQTAQGRGSTIQVRGLKSGTVADFTAPGSMPTIATVDVDGLVLAGSDTHVAGFDITVDPQTLIVCLLSDICSGIGGGSDKSNVYITDNALSGYTGVLFDTNNSGIHVSGNSSKIQSDLSILTVETVTFT